VINVYSCQRLPLQRLPHPSPSNIMSQPEVWTSTRHKFSVIITLESILQRKGVEEDFL
jgi:hypothetical protein